MRIQAINEAINPKKAFYCLETLNSRVFSEKHPFFFKTLACFKKNIRFFSELSLVFRKTSVFFQNYRVFRENHSFFFETLACF